MAIPAQYRRFIFIGGRYLEDREMNTLQSFYLNAEEQGEGSIYREGATFNVVPIVTGNTVTLTPINDTLPMLAFVDGRFEPFTSGIGSDGNTWSCFNPLDFTADSSPGTYSIYLNYEIAIISAGPSGPTNDPTLVDTLTSAPTAEAGQLNMNITLVDNSSTPLNNTTQVEKNTIPIVLFNIVRSGGGSLSVSYLDNVFAQSQATEYVSGLVKTTTGNPVVIAEDDPSVTNARDPVAGSVVNASIATLVPGGTNPNGSPITPVTSGPGLSSDNIIYSTLSTTLTWVLGALFGWIGNTSLLGTGNLMSSIIATLVAHVGVPLGSNATHPMPTAAQVGAAPLSHVGQNLDLSTSHPPVIQTDTDAWTVIDTGADPSAYAFQTRNGSTVKGGILHSGDVYSGPANAITSVPAIGGFYSGPLGLMSNIALLLSQLASVPAVNLAPYATISYVDTTEASILGTAEAFTTSLHYPMQERLFLGYFTHGAAVDAATLTPAFLSPISGYQYTQSNVQFYECELIATRSPQTPFTNGQSTDPGQSGSNPLGHNYWLWWTQSNVNANTLQVYLTQGYILNSDQSETDVNAGYCKVFVTVKRA